MKQTKLFGIFEEERNRKRLLFTKSFVPAARHFGEEVVKAEGVEYRQFNPCRSKFAAAIMRGLSFSPFKEKSVVLYLGAAHGYTASFLSDICRKGFIFAVEFAPTVARNLVYVCEAKKNIAPILADANHPETYENNVMKNVDVVYQDIAQKNQVEILLKNADSFLKKDGFAMIAVKARSVDVTKHPSKVFEEVKTKLEKKLELVDYRRLDPFEKDHALFTLKKKY
jgi:fibrillarin-like pre-rRNA processing protein